MKKNIYFFLALLSAVKLFCMDKADQAGSVVVASTYYGDGHEKGAGHRLVAQVRLVRSESERALGFHQRREILENAAILKKLSQNPVDLIAMDSGRSVDLKPKKVSAIPPVRADTADEKYEGSDTSAGGSPTLKEKAENKKPE